MRTLCGTILAAAVAAVAAAAPLAEYPGEVGEKTGWKCVGSEEGGQKGQSILIQLH